jgi:TonB family protein
VVKREGVEQCVTPQGKLHGMVRVRSEATGKVVLEQRWVNDQLDGPARGWHDNGQLESESSYKAGTPDGAWKEWWPNGLPASESQYRMGERTGTWTLLYGSGKPAWQRVYGPGGKLKSEATFDESGKKDGKELSRAVIARVMHGARPALRLCYEAELQSDAKLKGQLRVDFEIGPSGAVQGAKLEESTLHNGKVEQCVLKSLARVEFPRPPDGQPVPISFPFTFKGAQAKQPKQSDLPPPDEDE